MIRAAPIALVFVVNLMIAQPSLNLYIASRDNTNIVKHGKTAEGKRRYKCRNPECTRHRYVLAYSYRGYLPTAK